MQVSLESGEGLQREMRVDLPAEDIETEVEKRLQKFARSARVPGFRPGKVPVRVLRQQYGSQVVSEVLGDIVQTTLPQALEQEGVTLAGSPEIEPDVDMKARRYGYKARFEVFPTIELTTLSGRQILRPVAQVEDADVDQMIERLRGQRQTWDDVERAAQKDDQVKVSFVGTIDGEPFEGGAVEDFPIELGSGRMIPGFEDQIVGASAGDQLSFDLSFPEDYPSKPLAGKEARFEVNVQSVAVACLPEVDDAFIKEMGVESGEMADFRNDVRETMERELTRRIEDVVKSRVIEALVEVNPIEVPKALIEQEARSMRESFARSVGIKQPATVADSLFMDPARYRVATGLLITEAIKHFGLTTDDDAVREKATQLAASYQQPQQVINHYTNTKEGTAQIRALLLEQQAVARLLEDAQVEDEPRAVFDMIDKNP